MYWLSWKAEWNEKRIVEKINCEIFKYMQSMEGKINQLQSTISQMENTLLTQQAINNVIDDKGKINYFPQWKKIGF